MTTFSQRYGYAPIQDLIQIEFMNEQLRTSLWNVLQLKIWDSQGFQVSFRGAEREIEGFSRRLWADYFKLPVDGRPRSHYGVSNEKTLAYIRSYFFAAEWHEAYSFVEFVVTLYERTRPRLKDSFNSVLEREMSGYRFVGSLLAPVTSSIEIASLADAVGDRRFAGVDQHLRRSLELLSDRESPDYRNSIKEAISAVEAMARHVTGKPRATLGDALKALEKNGKLHPALSSGFSNLYGYTSDASGIRHAIQDEPNLTQADAKYFLLSCTSFVNYLKESVA